MMRQSRVAESVADELRSEILARKVGEGDMLAPQDVLVERFEVSPTSVRTALSILEVEGLVSVRRGRMGGAVVHAPQPHRIAYQAAMVLQADRVRLFDVAEGIGRLEPVVAAMCAERSDRGALVDELRAIIAAHREALGGQPAVAQELSENFHRAVVSGCGNAAVALVITSLLDIWHAHLHWWTAAVPPGEALFEPETQAAIIRAHELLTDAISDGDAETASRIASLHGERVHEHHFGAPSVSRESIVNCMLQRR